MVENKKYKVLSDNQSTNKQSLEKNCSSDHINMEDEVLCKKHGVWCRIKTRLRLKKRKGKKSSAYNSEKDCLITATSKESLLDPSEEYSYKGRNFHVAGVDENYKLLKEVNDNFSPIENPENFDRLSDDGSVEMNEKNAILGKEDQKRTLKEILSKKWHGKKAKRVRKGIRSGTRSSIKYLQTGTMHIHTLFPDATTFASAMSRRHQPV